MAITRTIECDKCHKTQTEPVPNVGWQGWGAIHGVELNGVANPNLCPECLAPVMEFIDKETD